MYPVLLINSKHKIDSKRVNVILGHASTLYKLS